MPFADDATVIARLLDHIDKGTTDLSEGVWREPAANYRSPERLAAEIALMRRTPTPFCPSAALPEAGSYIAREAAGTPVLVVRGADGVVRAFRNACRHRGVQLVDGAGCKSAFTCRYHAWTYGLDGGLRGVPHEYGFPGLDKSAHGLAPMKAVEGGGLVFVTQEGGAEPDVMPDVLGEEWRLAGAGEQELPFNWKIFVDGLIEGYHIRSTHPETFYPRQYDNVNVVEYWGRNARVTYPYKTIERLRNAPAGERCATAVTTQVTHFFPNAAVATFPTHRTFTVLEPLAVDRTRNVSFTLVNAAAAEPSEKVSKRQDFVAEGVKEDREVGIAVQRGLASGANAHFTFGLFEGALRHFHSNLAQAIGDAC